MFTAYFAIFGNVDRSSEVIEAGAFKNLGDFSQDGWIGINHDMDELPIAMIETASQDAKGLLIRGRFHSTPAAQAARTVVVERMKAGKAVKCSIGYKVLNDVQDIISGKAVRRLTAINLYEASFVNLPCNPAAEVVAAKSMESAVESKVISLDDLKGYLDGLKAGRVISRANHTQMKCWHKSLSECCEGLKAMIDAHDPDGAEEDDKAGAHQPPKLRADDATAPSVSPNRAAGGGIVKSLDKLRASIVRARLQASTQ